MDRTEPAPAHRLGDHTTTDLSPAGAVLVPLGSTEQHGPHLPLDTDTRIATALAEAVAAGLHAIGRSDVTVAPPLPYGASGEHRGFAGTMSIGVEVLAELIVELVRSVDGDAVHVVLVNGHGGNRRSVQIALERLEAEGRSASAVAPRYDGDAHAGHMETSLLLHLDPAAVHVDRLEPGRTEPLTELLADLERDGVKAVSPNGILGDPTSANADDGRALFERLVAELTQEVADALPRRLGRPAGQRDDVHA